jgi:hypothetical protein
LTESKKDKGRAAGEFTPKLCAELMKEFKPLERENRPFANPPENAPASGASA